jgi:hypothetical protein
MIIGEGEKIKSIPFKHILIFVGLVICARSSAFSVRGKSSAPFVRGGLIFRFGFMKIFHNMNKNHVYRKEDVKTDVLFPVVDFKSLDLIDHSNMYNIVGLVGDQYIVKTGKGLKRVKIKVSDNKRIGDQIKIEKL